MYRIANATRDTCTQVDARRQNANGIRLISRARVCFGGVRHRDKNSGIEITHAHTHAHTHTSWRLIDNNTHSNTMPVYNCTSSTVARTASGFSASTKPHAAAGRAQLLESRHCARHRSQCMRGPCSSCCSRRRRRRRGAHNVGIVLT